MERLTTDNPQNNFQTLMNYAYAKDGAVHLAYGEGVENVGLCEYIAMMCGCSSVKSPQDVMDGSCMECDCQFAILNAVATQAAELRGRLKAIEDILGPTYDLSRLKELVEANREGRCVVMPAPFGATVYSITHNRTKYGKVTKCVKKAKMSWYNAQDYTSNFGKTIFLTREAAEKALEERNG